MFTGLVKQKGKLMRRGDDGVVIRCEPFDPPLRPGDSIAVDGACLTVAKLLPDGFHADLLGATAQDSTLGQMVVGSPVNLEPALRMGESLGGHFVQGHVDGTAKIRSVAAQDNGQWEVAISIPEWLKGQLLPKGSVAVNGVSLTVQRIERDHFVLEIIPTTWRETNFSNFTPGQEVNIEVDLIAKTVRQSISQLGEGQSALSAEDLARWGYGK